MCGIVGFCGNGAVQKTYQGLKRLEYRGYDSAGLSCISQGEIKTVKVVGSVNGLEGKVENLTSTLCIAHTRWATHGKATLQNAHPHVFGNFAIVHNGIIENYLSLKNECVSLGENFTSQTDSEVVAHLLDRYFEGDVLSAIYRVVKRLKGAFALGILCRQFNGLCIVKRKSSAILGFAKDGIYLASDIPALTNATAYYAMNDGEVAIISNGKATVYNAFGEIVNYKTTPLGTEYKSTSLCGYPHYMLKEIAFSAQTLRQTASAFTYSPHLKRIKSRLKSADKIIICGCGTAYNSGAMAKYILNGVSAPVTVEVASEFRYYPTDMSPSTVFIAVSQSGETADTIGAAEVAKGKGAFVLCITNVQTSALARLADACLFTRAQAEICVAATKSYCGQLACFYMLSALLCGNLQYQKRALFSASRHISATVKSSYKLNALANACAKSKAVFFLGKGADVALATEASLKLKEVSYVFSSAYPSGELKHGTLALIDGQTFSVVLACQKSVLDKCKNTVEQIKSRGGKTAVITPFKSLASSLSGVADFVILLPKVGGKSSALSSVFSATCTLQLLAYKTALLCGNDPDKPRNLAKSVTVE